MKQWIVIGGGISGLAAALELHHLDPSCQVNLLESAGRLGGVLETLNIDDCLIERSADNFATLIPNARDLSARYGLLPELIQPNPQGRQAFVYCQGHTHPIPAGFSLMQPTRIASIITTPLLSWPGKLRLLKEYWVKAAPPNETDDESLESFAVRRLGREAFDKLVEPIVSGIFTADPKTLSMAATMPQFLAMERQYGGLIRGYLAARKQDAAAVARRASGARYDQFMAPRLGMSWWIDSLARQLPAGSAQLNTQVKSLQRLSHGKWQVTTSSDRVLEADGVVLATPAQVTAQLLQPLIPEAARLVSSIPYASSAVVAMVVDQDQFQGRLDGFGLVVPSCEGRQALAISFTSNKYPGRTPDGQILLRIFLGGALHPEVLESTDQKLQEIANREVADILKWSGRGLKWQAVIRWMHSMPQYLVGHMSKVRDIQRSIATLPGIEICGAAYSGVGIPQCVRSGQQAAANLCGIQGDSRNVTAT